MNRILNIDMVIIPLVQIYFNLPWSIIVEGQRLPCSCSGIDGFAVLVVELDLQDPPLPLELPVSITT